MSIETAEVPSPATRLEYLGMKISDKVTFLPRNLDSAESADELVYAEMALTLKKILAREGVSTEVPRSDKAIATIHERHVDWLMPTLFVGGMVLSNEPHVVAVALNVIGNYLSQFVYGTPADGRAVTLEVFVETDRRGSCTLVTYRGDLGGLSEVADVVKDLTNGN